MTEEQCKPEAGQKVGQGRRFYVFSGQRVPATLKSRELWACAAAAIAMVIGVILVVFLPRVAPITDSATIAVLLLVSLLVYGVGSGRVREFTGPLGLGAKLTEVENELKKTKEDIEAIRTALRGILTKHEWGPLKGLSGTDEVRLPRKMPNLINYLHRLDALEYIQPNNKEGLHGIEKMADDEEFDLRDHFHITKAGITYLGITEYLGIFKHGAKWHDPHPYDDTPRT